PPAPAPYELLFEASVVPTERLAHARLQLGPSRVHRIVFTIDPSRHTGWHGDGNVTVEGGTVTWEPPRTGGSLRDDFRIDRLRNATAYDARIPEQWSIFRGGDLFPPARVLAQKGAYSASTLRLRVPEGWRIAVPFERLPDGRYRVDNPRRRFDRPTGW